MQRAPLLHDDSEMSEVDPFSARKFFSPFFVCASLERDTATLADGACWTATREKSTRRGRGKFQVPYPWIFWAVFIALGECPCAFGGCLSDVRGRQSCGAYWTASSSTCFQWLSTFRRST